ncbi:MAG: hypothetical protein IJH28_05405 [Mogibacterium sp.]|nr:hypothetical protein [Mogibacterium sp.]
MAYATIADIQDRSIRSFSADELKVCQNLLDDAAILIDRFNKSATEDIKKVVSCRVVIRAIGSGGDNGVPIGASQGSMSALGYSQSWTLGASGASGELYLSKTEKQLLGGGSKIGSHSPVEELVPETEE